MVFLSTDCPARGSITASSSLTMLPVRELEKNKNKKNLYYISRLYMYHAVENSSVCKLEKQNEQKRENT